MASDPSLPPPGGPPAPQAPPSEPRGSRRGPSVSPRLTAALAIAVVIAVVLFLVTRGGGSKSGSTASTAAPTPPAVTRSPPSLATAASLRTLQTQLGHPVYWAGPANGRVLSSQQASDKSVELRYLPAGTPLNSPAQQGLSVVSYPETNAYALAQAGAKRPGAHAHRLPGGGLAVSPPNLPTNVFLSRPGSAVLVEVFDPSPGTALHDVLSGRIRPVG